ncbi:sugar ABC transporter substrate-binding protein [Subtercola sp. Z020]|uniref:sugar ABC transporter substrate-binding protein n=1 Tax=Subtercola sp. Z020 TaxID=2080582 RepID=UPI00130EE1CE|nr:sugar ABC transporter substrate-binding protein [Subtercola sp. Z020]
MKLGPQRRIGAIASVIVAAALVLSGCSTASAPEATSASGLPVKTIGVWQSQASGDGEKQTLSAIQAAADAVGWKTVVTDSNGDPKAMASTMQSLITQKVDAILTVYVATGLIAPQLKAAKAAGIPVISVGYQGTPTDDLTAEYAPDQAEQTTMLLKRMGEDLPNGGTVAPLAVAGYYGIDQEVDTLKSEAGTYKFTPLERVDVPVTDIFGGTTSAAVDVLNANPDLAALFTTLDIGAQSAVPALTQTGRDVPIYSFGAIPGSLAFVRTGEVTLVTSDGAKSGFIAVDALLDYWVNGTAIPKTTPTEDAFEYTIVDKTTAPADGTEVYPEADFAKPFLDKWKTEYKI